MARGFGASFGVSGTTDKITTGYTTVPSATYSLSIWMWVNGKGQANFGDSINQQGGGTRNFVVFMNNSVTSIGFSQAFSTANGGWTINGNGAGIWQHLAITYDASSTGNTPKMYINGASQSVTTTQAPIGTRVTGATAIIVGAATGNNTFDGMLAEFGYWNGSILTASEIFALAKGVPPLFIRPTGLSLYLPLLGTGSGEPDWGPSRVTQTLTGTAKRNHAPVSF